MDFHESSESCDNVLRNVTTEKNNTTSADLISFAAAKKTIESGFHNFNDSNDQILDCKSDSSFHSIGTDEDDITNDNIGTVNSHSNEFLDDDVNKIVKANEGSSVIGQFEFKTGNLCGEENVENSINNDSELLFDSGELEDQDNISLKFMKSNISTREMATEDENAGTDDFIDDRSKDSTNTERHTVENFVHHSGDEKGRSNNDLVETKSSYDTRTTHDDFPTNVVDEADESFSLEEVLEESECSDKDQTRINFSNDEHLAFDEDSMASIQAENSESLILENGDELTTAGETVLNNETADPLEIEDHLICGEVVKDTVTVENIESNSEENAENNSEENDVTNSENTDEDFLPVIVPCPVSSSTDNIALKCEVSSEKSENSAKSPSEENSSEVVTTETETIDSSCIINDITIGSFPSKNKQPENFPSNHHLRSSIVSLEGDIQHSAAKDETCHQNSTEVPKDEVSSSHGDSVSSGESTNTRPSVSDIQNEKEALQENEKTAKSSTNPEESSLIEELVSDSTPDVLSNLRRRVSLRCRNNSDGSEPTLSDASLPGESDSLTINEEKRNRPNTLRTPKSTSRSPSSRSNWQPKIDDVKSASSNFSIFLKKFSEDSLSDTGIKKEVIDQSYEMDFATKERFNLVDFSIKLEKIAVDSDVEIMSPPRRTRTRPYARRSLDNNKSSRSRSRSTMLRNRMRSRTTTNRSRPNDQKVSRPNSARRLPDEPVSTRSVAHGDDKRVNRVNGQMAKRSAARRPANNSQASSSNSVRRNNDHGRSLRSTGNEEDRDRIDFLSIFNLRSRQGNSDENVKGILVKPKINKVRRKKVSFHLPSEKNALTEQNNSSSEEGNSSSKPSKEEDSFPKLEVKVPPLRYFEEDSSSKSAVTVPSRSADRKRNASTQSNKKSAPIPAKRSRSSRVPKEHESEDEVIDENPFDKLEELADAVRKTVDVWFECQCCNQKYYLIENAKQHVRTHFPNCLTN